MRRATLLALLCAVLAPAIAGEASDALLKLLNSRAAGSPRQYAAAAHEVAEAAARGQPLQQFVLALVSADPELPESVRPQPKVRAEYLANGRPRIRQLAEEKDNPLAWYLLYLETREPALLDKAVAGGNVQALNLAGTQRLQTALENPSLPDCAEVMRTCFGYFLRAAEQGDANGYNNLGICRQNGYGCPRDEAAAFASFSRAAQMGHAEAVNNLGRFHREGVGVRRDPAAALRCFRLSAAQGNMWGQLNYALALMRGEGIEADAPRAVALLESIAERGHPEAMDCLADCYGRGIGALAPDAHKAFVWTIRARAARGNASAIEWLKENHEDTHDR